MNGKENDGQKIGGQKGEMLIKRKEMVLKIMENGRKMKKGEVVEKNEVERR